MATLIENLRKIRGEAVYGPDMREAIAQAIEQADDGAIELLARVAQIVEDRELFVNLEPLGDGDYRMEIVNAEEPET